MSTVAFFSSFMMLSWFDRLNCADNNKSFPLVFIYTISNNKYAHYKQHFLEKNEIAGRYGSKNYLSASSNHNFNFNTHKQKKIKINTVKYKMQEL